MKNAETHQPMPCSLEAEKGLLCSMLMRGELLDFYKDLAPEAFNLPAHRLIYESLRMIAAAGKPCEDFIVFTQHLRDNKLLDSCGGVGNITDIATYVSTPANHPYYAEIVREKYARRIVIQTASAMNREARNEAPDLAAVVESATQSILSLRQLLNPKSI